MEIYISGLITKDTPRQVTDALAQAKQGETVTVEINSPGGDAAAALDIYTQLKRLAQPVVALIYGMTASAATIIAMGARHIAIDSHALLLIHNATANVIEWGSYNKEELDGILQRISSDRHNLATIDALLADIYATHADGKTTAATFADVMNAGLWLTPQQALTLGLVDEITATGQDTHPLTPTNSPNNKQNKQTNTMEAKLIAQALGYHDGTFESKDGYVSFKNEDVTTVEKRMAELTKALNDAQQANDQLEAALKTAQGLIAEKDKQLQEQQQANDGKDKQIEEQKQQLESKDKQIEEQKQRIEEKDKKVNEQEEQITNLKAAPGSDTDNSPLYEAYANTTGSRKLFDIINE